MEKDKFEDLIAKHVGGLSQDDLIKRIKDCQGVVDKLKSDPMWLFILADANRWVDRLNSQWQTAYDERTLNGLRVLKLAYQHIADLPDKYKVDLKSAQEELDRQRNVDSSIQKDYDLETNMDAT